MLLEMVWPQVIGVWPQPLWSKQRSATKAANQANIDVGLIEGLGDHTRNEVGEFISKCICLILFLNVEGLPLGKYSLKVRFVGSNHPLQAITRKSMDERY